MTDKVANQEQLTTYFADNCVKLVKYYKANLPLEQKHLAKNWTFYFVYRAPTNPLIGNKGYYQGGIIDRSTRVWHLTVTAADSVQCLRMIESELVDMVNAQDNVGGEYGTSG